MVGGGVNIVIFLGSERQRFEDAAERAPAGRVWMWQIDAVLCDWLPSSKVGSDSAS